MFLIKWLLKVIDSYWWWRWREFHHFCSEITCRTFFFLSLSLSPWFIVSLRVRLWVCACACAEVHSNRAIDFICVNFQFDMLDFSPNYYDYNLIHIYRALYLSVWPLGYLIGIRLQWEPESNNYIVLRVYSFEKISLSGSSLRCEKKAIENFHSCCTSYKPKASCLRFWWVDVWTRAQVCLCVCANDVVRKILKCY